jgi:hypothetical protein
MTIEDLIAKAKKLKIEFDEENITEDELKAMIEVAEAEEELETKKVDSDPEYLKSELKKAIEKRDTAKSERRKLLADKKLLEEQLKKAPNVSEIETLRDELKTLKEFKSEIDLEKVENERKKMDKITRLENDHQVELKKIEDELKAERETIAQIKDEEETAKTSLKEQVKELRIARLESEIIKTAATLNAWNPDQVARLVKSDFVYDDDLGKFVHTVRDSKGKIKEEKDVDEFVTDYLKMEENENLIRSKVNKDALHTDKELEIDNRRGSDSRKKADKAKSYDPKDPEIVEAAEMDGMEVPRYIEKVLKPMDAALAKRENNNDD